MGYLGFIPGLSLFAADKPYDLGIRYTQQEYFSYVQKSGTKISHLRQEVDPASSIIYSGQKPLKQSFSQEEISARLNFFQWKYMPFVNTQVRINQDGSIEFSGNFQTDRFDGFLAKVYNSGYSKDDVKYGLKVFGGLMSSPPVYTKFKASVENNISTISIEKIKVGRLNLPLEEINANGILKKITQKVIGNVHGLYIKSLSFNEGKMEFEGTVPETEAVEIME